MTWRIGRTTLANGPNRVAGPQRLAQNGDTCTMEGVFYPATEQPSTVEAETFRQQMLGYQPGTIIPVVAPEDYDLTGYWRVLQVDVANGKGYREQGLLAWSMALERVANGYALPLVELTWFENDRDIGETQVAYDPVSAEPYVWLPASMAHHTDRVVTASARPVAGGSVVRRPYLGGPSSGVVSYGIAPESFYEGAATIEVRDGGRWAPVSGRQLPDVDAGSVRIGNGLVRWGWDGDDIRVEAWSTHLGQWRTVCDDLRVLMGGATVAYRPYAVRVLRNEVDRCTVRYSMASAIDLDEPTTTLDVSVGRGDAFAACTVTQDDNDDIVLRSVSYLSVTADPCVQGIVYQTATGVDALILATNGAYSLSETASDPPSGEYFGQVDMTFGVGVTQSTFMVGVQRENASGTVASGDAADNVVGQWWAAVATSQRVR